MLIYSSEVLGFYKSKSIETVHLQLCKKLLGVKQTAQNDFVYGELGRTGYQSYRYISVDRYWLKIVTSEERKYPKQIYKTMLNDNEE